MRHTIFMIVTLFLTLLSLSKAQPADRYPCSQRDAKAIETAIMEYVKTNTAVSPDHVKIMSEKCVSDYASAVVHPINQVTDDAMVYLHKTNNRWNVLSLGTAFDEKFLSQLPKALRDNQ